MSLPSSSIPFRPWLWTRSQQSARLALPANTPRPQRQPFHSSRSAYLPARSPRARRVANRTTDYVSNDGLMRNTKHAAPIHVQESLLNFFQLGADDYFMSAKKEGILPEVVTKRVFFNFGVQLLKAQFTDYPTALSIRRISTDAELVFKIGIAVSAVQPSITEWLLAACARAGSRTAVLIAAKNFLHQPRTLSDTQIGILAEVKRLALEENDPYAIILHAWVIGQRNGEYKEGIALLRPVLDAMYPTRDPRDVEPILRGFPKPWSVYINLLMSLGKRRELKKVHRIAAIDYLDPEALLVHAYNLLESKQDSSEKNDSSMKSKDDFTEYEQLMCLAATGGSGDACRRLGNFYYLKYLNLKPISLDYIDKDKNPSIRQPIENRVAAAEDRIAHEKAMKTWDPRGRPETFLEYARYYLRIEPSRDYLLELVKDWYRMAVNFDDRKACLLLARLVKQAGQLERAFGLLAEAQLTNSKLDNTDPEVRSFGKKADALRMAWMRGSDPKFRDSDYEL